jgi:hydroxyethylthiazole kinase-like uncharacterized protein yjeF
VSIDRPACPPTITPMDDPKTAPLIMTRDEVRAFDAWAIQHVGIPGVVLMENAGRACADLIQQRLAGIDRPRVCVVCGTGNNGGDGFVIARHLLNDGLAVTLALCGDRSKVAGDAKIHLDVLQHMGQPIESLDVGARAIDVRIKELASGAHLVVDAIFGTGLRGDVSPPCARLIEAMNRLGIPIVSVDIPSGLDADTGRPLGAAIRATLTVTFVAMKRGFLSSEARSYTGEVMVASIGIHPRFSSRPASGEHGP